MSTYAHAHVPTYIPSTSTTPTSLQAILKKNLAKTGWKKTWNEFSCEEKKLNMLNDIKDKIQEVGCI